MKSCGQQEAYLQLFRDNSSFPSSTLPDSLLRVEHIAKQAHLPLTLTTNPPPLSCQSALHTENV